MPAVRGPVPKRSTQRRRRNEPEIPVDKVSGAPDVTVPPPDPQWHPVVLAWYQALVDSGQRVFYEPSDWATAALVAECMSRDLKPQVVGISLENGEPMIAPKPMPGASLAAYLRAMGVLMVTEGDRRRARLELQRPAGQSAGDVPGVPKLDDYRDRAV